MEAAEIIEEEEEEAEAAEFIKPSFSMIEKLSTFGTMLLILENDDDCENAELQYVIQVLRKKQKTI